MLFSFAACSNGDDENEGKSEIQKSDSQTQSLASSGTLSSSSVNASTNLLGQNTVKVSTAESGTYYEFTEIPSINASLVSRAATVNTSKSGTWEFYEKNVHKYGGSYKGDILAFSTVVSESSTEGLALELTVEKALDNGSLVTVVADSKNTFKFEVNADKSFEVTIPAVTISESSKKYAINVSDSDGCTVQIGYYLETVTTATRGDSLTLKVTPPEDTAEVGYEIDTVTVTKDSDNSELELGEPERIFNTRTSCYDFRMPDSSITIKVTCKRVGFHPVIVPSDYDNTKAISITASVFGEPDKDITKVKAGTRILLQIKFANETVGIDELSITDGNGKKIATTNENYIDSSSGHSYSCIFIMPDSNANVSATFKEITLYDITFDFSSINIAENQKIYYIKINSNLEKFRPGNTVQIFVNTTRCESLAIADSSGQTVSFEPAEASSYMESYYKCYEFTMPGSNVTITPTITGKNSGTN
ncbi:MAG: hypothetical protein IJ158_11410 [Treponema sp.]|nr:hypothetical protein [Treponema sp.]